MTTRDELLRNSVTDVRRVVEEQQEELAQEKAMKAFAEKHRKENAMFSDEQIKYMVDRFLGWQLPTNFNPDNGISFDPIMNKGYVFESRREPVGTNLFDATQAETMVRYMVEGMSKSILTQQPVTPEDIRKGCPHAFQDMHYGVPACTIEPCHCKAILALFQGAAPMP